MLNRNLWWFIASLVVIAVVSFAFFYPDASQGNQLQQYDIRQGIANGQEAKTFQETTGETTWWTNSLFSGMPTFQISPTYPSNHLFNWIGTVMGLGLPQPSGLVAMMMVGFLILLTAMRLKPGISLLGAIAYGFSTYFIILIGAGHIWKFVTLAYIPPTIAGLVLCYRGRYLLGAGLAAVFGMMQIASNHAQMTYYFLFVIVGMVLAYLYMALRQKKWRQFQLGTAALIVAGVLAVGANLPSLYNTYEYSKLTMRGQHSELTPLKGAKPEGETKGLNKDYITQYSYQPSETFSLLIPNIKGGASARPTQGQMQMMSLAKLDKAQEMAANGEVDQMQSQYLEQFTQYFGDPEGTNGPVYVGALIFALFLVGCVIVRGPVKWVLLVLTAFSIVLAWGRHAIGFTDLMLDFVPMYSKFRAVESILVIAEFTMPLLAVLALQKIVTSKDRQRLLLPLMVMFGIATLICLAGILTPGIFGGSVTESDYERDHMITKQLLAAGYSAQQAAEFSLNNPSIYSAVDQLRTSLVVNDSLRSLVVLLIGFVFILLYLREKITAVVAIAAVGLVTLVDLYTVNKRYIAHDSFQPKELEVDVPIAKTPADEMILQDTTMNYRVMDFQRFYSPEPSYYHKAIGGYHAGKLARYQDLIDRHLGHFFDGTGPQEADFNVLNMLNARYFVLDNGQAPQLNPDALGNGWFVDRVKYVGDADSEMEALSHINPGTEAVATKNFEALLGPGQAVSPGDTIIETTYAPNQLTYKVRSKNGGVAVFSEIYFPWGWEATIDGKPAQLARVDYVLRALKVPAGEHVVQMKFEPKSLNTSVTWATICVIIIYVLLLAGILVSVLRPQDPKPEEEKKPE